MTFLIDFLAKLALGGLEVYLQRRDLRSAAFAEVSDKASELAIKAFNFKVLAASDPAGAAELRVRDRTGKLTLPGPPSDPPGEA